MAIDNRRKRASIAALGLAFLGPSVVPDGTLAQADRQAIAHSYYGIEAGGAIVQIGATCQLENYAATGGITLERILGGTSQLENHGATGGITLERTLGGTSQIAAFTSSGGIQVGEAASGETGHGYIQGKRKPGSQKPGRREYQLGLAPAKMLIQKAAEEQQVDPTPDLVKSLMADLAVQQKAIEEKASQLEKLKKIGQARKQLDQIRADFLIFEQVLNDLETERLRLIEAELLESKEAARNEAKEEMMVIDAVKKYFFPFMDS